MSVGCVSYITNFLMHLTLKNLISSITPIHRVKDPCGFNGQRHLHQVFCNTSPMMLLCSNIEIKHLGHVPSTPLTDFMHIETFSTDPIRLVWRRARCFEYLHCYWCIILAYTTVRSVSEESTLLKQSWQPCSAVLFIVPTSLSAVLCRILTARFELFFSLCHLTKFPKS